MIDVKFYICPKCKTVICIDKRFWNDNIRCTVCNEPVESAEDDFDLSQVLDEEKQDNGIKIPD